MNLNIHPVHFTIDSKLTDLVKEKIKKIEKFNDGITNVDVYLVLENTSSDHVKNKIVEIKVNAYNKKLFTKEVSKTFEDAFSIALQEIVSQLKKNKDILKG
jgi:ribosomal subunit interface protein